MTALRAAVPWSRRARVALEAAITISATIWLSRFESGPGRVVRDWVPVLYLLAMYWAPARLVTSTLVWFEGWLVGVDRRCFGERGNDGGRMPQWLIETLEASYLLCYPLIPAGMACLYLGGAAAHADRYWTAVLLAGALSYGFLPWLPTRAPRETFGPPRASVVGTLNTLVVLRTSVHWNTFPSGHVATAMAASLAVAVALPVAGFAMAVIAFGIAVASSVGRYHYMADLAAGFAAAVIAFMVSNLAL
jgi:hypothetical protein